MRKRAARDGLDSSWPNVIALQGEKFYDVLIGEHPLGGPVFRWVYQVV